jgi:hypothetical protein
MQVADTSALYSGYIWFREAEVFCESPQSLIEIYYITNISCRESCVYAVNFLNFVWNNIKTVNYTWNSREKNCFAMKYTRLIEFILFSSQ